MVSETQNRAGQMPEFSNPFPPQVQTVGVFAPAGIPEPARFERGLARLRDWGLEVVLACPRQAERFLSAPDAVRAAALNELLHDPRVDLLLAARGGYGCARILDRVDFRALQARGIPLVGYSDITALHAAAFSQGSGAHIAGPMVCSALARQPVEDGEARGLDVVLESFRQALAGAPFTVAASLRTLREGVTEGRLLPANLAVLASLIGTPFMPDLTGVVLVLEDVGEAAYRVDRYLQQLHQAGHLGRLAGLAYGQFSEGDDAHWLPSVVADFAQRVQGPVVAGLDFGHGFPSLSLPVGRLCRLTAAASGARLEISGALPGSARREAAVQAASECSTVTQR
jgi:muramoyltetrapeptide carboxypeptidase